MFLSDGTFHQTFGREQLNCPVDAAVTSDDELLVLDHSNNCIYRLSLDGDYIDKFSNHDDELCYPRSIDIPIDPNDFILVTNSGNNQIVIFKKYGNLVHKFGSSGSGDGKFSYPHGVAVNKNGEIYASDCYNRKIQIFSQYYIIKFVYLCSDFVD